jgi:RHS repeat-associated protein
VQERFVYDPYGNVTVLTPAGTLRGSGAASASNFKWVDLYQDGTLDTATGLYNFRYRDYDPTLQRWMEVDPAHYIDGANMYQYVGSSPTTNTDPTGLNCYPVLRPYDPREGLRSGPPKMLIEQNGQEYEVGEECCTTLTIIVEFSGSGIKNVGHTGVGIDNDYFDMGPANQVGFFGTTGAISWWSNPATKGIGDLPGILNQIKTLLTPNGGAIFTVEVPKGQGDTIWEYWQSVYTAMADGQVNYSVYNGSDCTTTVGYGLEGIAGIPQFSISPWEDPDGFAQLLANKLVNTCGPNRGQPADFTVF